MASSKRLCRLLPQKKNFKFLLLEMVMIKCQDAGQEVSGWERCYKEIFRGILQK